MNHRRAACMILLLLIVTPSAWADPPFWDPDFGMDTGFSSDDGETPRALGFDFPFAGDTYDHVSIGSNGGVSLHQVPPPWATSDVRRDFTRDEPTFEADFLGRGQPIITAFGSDLDNNDGDTGDIHFKSDGRAATITWADFATDENDSTPFLTFQMRLDTTGRIVLSYRSFQVAPTEDNLFTGVLVGVSDGSGSLSMPASADLSTTSADSGSDPYLFEFWCSARPLSTCADDSRPDLTQFDLEQRTVVFEPNGQGGFVRNENYPGKSSGNGSTDSENEPTTAANGGGAVGLWPLLLLAGLAALVPHSGDNKLHSAAGAVRGLE